MERACRVTLVNLVMSLLTTTAVWAQAGSTAQVSGIVRDESGGVLPGATVTVTQTDTSLKRDTVTDADGSYALPNLPIGPYRLEVTLSGFRPYVQTGLVLQVNASPVINVTLMLGEVSETITVEANALVVETRSSVLGTVLENQRILQLPLNGRNPVDLIQLAGATVPQGTSSSRSMQGGQLIAVAGGQSAGVAYILDGASHNNPYDNANLPLPFPDALQEFRVETSALTAQQGMHSGAGVNAVTRSGTNRFHGSGFEFLRNHNMNATNPFAAKNPDGSRKDDGLKRNQYGGVVGGPVVTDRLFFFGGYQGTKTRQRPSDNIAFVPTAQMLAGDFTAIASAACNNGRQISLAAPFAGNRISSALLDKSALAVTSHLPATSDPCGRVNYQSVSRIDEIQAVGKIDFQWSSKHSLFGRYIATTYRTPPPFSLVDNILATVIGGRDNLAQSFTFGDNYVLSSTTLNAFRVAFNRTAIHRTHEDFFSAPDIGVKTYSYLPHYMLLAVTGGFSLGGGTESESTFDTNTYQISDDVTLVRGAHQFGFGGTWAYWRNVSLANVRSPGTFTFNGTATNLGLADFLTGRLTSLRQAAPNNLFMKQHYIGLYAQDTWRMGPRLTLNYGLRWEPWFPQQITNDAVYNFDMARFQQNLHSVVFPRAPAGFIYPGDSGFPNERAGMNKRWSNLAPRVGVAWDPKGDGRMSIRSSYGMAYDFVNAQYHLNTSIAPPWGYEVLLNSPAGGFTNPYLGVTGGNPFPVTFDQNAAFTPFGQFLALNPDLKTTTVHSYNASFQRQFLGNWVVTASYMGRYTSNLWNMKALNYGLPTVTSAGTVRCVATAANFQNCMNSILNQRRVLYQVDRVNAAFIGALDFHDDSGWERYNGMLLSVERRVPRGVSFTANYTLSHCVGLPSQVLPNPSTGWTDPNNPDFDRGNCVQDRRHIGNATVSVQTPDVQGTTMRLLASGWRVSGIFRAASGSPLNIVAGTDRALSGIGAQRVNVVSGADPYRDTGSLNYLNPAAFAQPALGTLGNFERNSLYGPGRWTLDAVLGRAFRFAGDHTVEVRVEAFNLTNNFLRNNPIQGFNQNTFGTIQAADDPRIMQLALKYTF